MSASFKSPPYASTIGGRERLREKLEQGVFGLGFAGFGLCLIVATVWLGSTLNSQIGPGHYVSVSLPESSSGSLFSAQDTLRIALTVRMEFVSGGVWIPDEDFDAFATRSLASNSYRAVTLQADGRLPYSAITAALQRLQKLGARRVYLMTYGSTDPLLMLLSAPWSTIPESH